MRELMQPLSVALRSLSRQPAVMIPAVLTLALGIGATTALFGYLALILWPTIEAPHPERVLWVYSGLPEEPRIPFSYGELQDFTRGQSAFSGLAAYSRFGSSIASGEQSHFAWGHLVTEGYFPFFAARPAAGRLLVPEDHRPGAPPVVVLGHYFWRGYLGGDPEIVGRELRINGVGMTVVGVAAKGFQGEGLASALYVPAVHSDVVMGVARVEDRDNRWLFALGRLAPGVSRAQARSALETRAKSLDESRPLTEGKPRQVTLVSATDHDPESTEPTFVDAARILLAAACLFLLLGCASIANLLLARAIAKQREWGIRASLGASRTRLASGVLAESLVLCLAGGLGGLAVAAALLRRIEDYLRVAPAGLGNWSEGTKGLSLDPRTVSFALAAALLCTVLGGLGPVLRILRGDLLVPLKSDAAAGGPGGGLAPRQALVVAQVALSVILLLGGGLLARTLESAHRVDPGFDPEGLLVITVNVPRNVMAATAGGSVYPRVLQEVRKVPGVASASLVQTAPLSGWGRDLYAAPAERPDDARVVASNLVGPDYFETLGLPVLAGRPLDERDREGAAPAVVVSRKLAESMWGGESPVGRTIHLSNPLRAGGKREPHQVVGMVPDVRKSALEEPLAMVYFSAEQRRHPRMTLLLRAAAPPAALAPELRRALRHAHPDLSVVEMMSLREQVARSLFPQRMHAEIAGLFAVLGLAVAVVGLFGLLSYSVTVRLRELAIRMAVGARPGDVQRLVVRQGLALVAAGAGVGLGGAFLLSRLMASVLFGVGAHDPLTFVAVPAALALLALPACWLPARRAARLDPSLALRGI